MVSFVTEGGDGRVHRITGTIRNVYKASDKSRSYKIKEIGGAEIQYTVQEQDVLGKSGGGSVGLKYQIGDHVQFERTGLMITGHIAKVYPRTKEYFVMEEAPSFQTWRLQEDQIIGKVLTGHTPEEEALELEEDISLAVAVQRGGEAAIMKLESSEEIQLEDSEEIKLEEQEQQPTQKIALYSGKTIPIAVKTKTDPESYFRYGFFILIGLVLWSAK